MSDVLDRAFDPRVTLADSTEVTVEPASAPNRVPGWRRSGRWVLLSIVVAQVLGSLRLRNSAFQDEALYLWAGHQMTAHLLHGTALYGNFSSYFSGSPGVYPVIASVVDSVFGLAGARGFNLVWMIVATLCVYGITKRTFSVHAAVPAAAAFGLSAPVLFVGHLATMDAMCVGLFALATYAGVRAAATKVWWALAVGPLLVLSIVTKYAAALFVPTVLAILVLESHRRHGARAAVARLGAAAAAAVVLIAAGIAAFGMSIPNGLKSTTINRTVALHAHAWDLISRALTLGGFFAAVALVGWSLVPRAQRLLGAVLFGTLLLAPTYHVYKGEPVSLSKHVGFGLFFAAPLVGVALYRLAGRGRRLSGRRFMAGVAVGLVLIVTGLAQSARLENEWPNSNALIVTLRALVRPESGRVLAEEAEVPRYRMRNAVQAWQWTDLHWFEYTNREGVYRVGLDAYRAAIEERYFDVIELRYGADAATAVAIRDDIARAGGYELVATIPFRTSVGSGAYTVWRRSST